MCKLQMRVGQTPFECYFVAELKLDSQLALSENSTAVLIYIHVNPGGLLTASPSGRVN